MELWCRVPNENWDNFQTLEGEGLNPSLYKGYMEGMFPTIAGGLIGDLPTKASYFIKNWEFGGGMTNTGKATVICGMDGKKIKPKKIFTTGHLSNKIHAEFETVFGHVITSTKSGAISVIYYQLAFVHDSISVQVKKVWEGPVLLVPNKFSCLQMAIGTAYKKANTFHCREAMYVRSS
jgi:hypothetical protein